MAKQIWQLSLEEFNKIKKLNKTQRQQLNGLYSEEEEEYFDLGEFKTIDQLLEKISSLKEKINSFLLRNKLDLEEMYLEGNELIVCGTSKKSDEELITLHRKELIRRKEYEDEFAAEGDAKTKEDALKQIDRLQKKFKIGAK